MQHQQSQQSVPVETAYNVALARVNALSRENIELTAALTETRAEVARLQEEAKELRQEVATEGQAGASEGG